MQSSRATRPRKTARGPARKAAREADTARVLRQFRQVFNAVKTHFKQVQKQAGLGGAQLWALSVIASHPGIGVGDLASAMDVHQSTASNLVRALLAADLIESSRKGADRRTVQLRLLPAGRRLLRRAPGPFAGVLPEALSQLDDRTLRRLQEDLAVLISLLHGSRSAARTPLAQL